MDLILLDKNFNICGIVEKYSELRWNRRYFDVGDFKLWLSPEYFDDIKNARYIYHSENDETAIIENLRYDLEQNGKHALYADGRMLEALFCDRVIDKTIMLDGNIETAVNGLVTDIAMTGSRKIDRLVIASTDGFDINISMQACGKELMGFLYSLLSKYGLSFSLHYDYLFDDIAFEIFQGKDRRRLQSKNSVAVFSADFENIRSERYIFSSVGYKNFAYIAGKETDTDRITTSVSLLEDGEERKELYVDASDIRKTLSDGTVLTDAEYLDSLQNRGMECLKSHRVIDNAECRIEDRANLIYRKDYDLGDICDFEDDSIGISESLMITELHETRSEKGSNIEAVFKRI